MVRKLIGGNKTGVSGIYEPDENISFVNSVNNLIGYDYNSKSPYNLTSNNTTQDLYLAEDIGKIYFLDSATDRISEYNLSDDGVSLDYYNLSSFNHNDRELACEDLFFSDDGTNLYIIGQNAATGSGLIVGSEYVHQYTLGTAWDITTAGYSTSFYVTTQTNTPTGMFIGAAGTSMYVVGGNTVYQYTLGTAWQVNTASYASKSVSVSAKESTPRAVFFKDDGTQMYVTGSISESIHQYSLGTAWDISTATFSKTFTIGGDPNWNGMYIKSDGKKLYLIGDRDATIAEYTLSVAWDISSIYGTGGIFYGGCSKYYAMNDIAHATPYRGIYFKPDGTEVYLVAQGGSKIISVPITTAWDIRTVNVNPSHFIGDFEYTANNNSGLYFSNDGTSAYTVSSSRLCQFKMNTPWSISSIPDTTSFFGVALQETNPTDLFFSDDGTKIYVPGRTALAGYGLTAGADYVHQYNLSSAWDITTAGYSTSFYVTSQDDFPNAVYIGAAGTSMYVFGDASNTIYQYTLGTAWEVNTASYSGLSISVNSQEQGPSGLFFKPDGTKVYIIGTSSDRVYQYSLGTAWDISTATYDDKSFSVSLTDGTPVGIYFKPDGTKFYFAGRSNTKIYQYSLGTAWDISTASYDDKGLGIYAFDGNMSGIHFNPDGTRIYIMGESLRTIMSLDLSVAWDISSSSVQSVIIPLLGTNNASSVVFKPDGKKVYIFDTSTIKQYSLLTAWDITTIVYDHKTLNTRHYEFNLGGMHFSHDGSRIYIVGASNDRVMVFFLQTPWEITNEIDAFYTDLFDNGRQGIYVTNDNCYILNSNTDQIYQFSFSTPGKFNSAGFTTSFSILSEIGNAEDLFFKDDGTTAYVVGGSTIYQYSLGTSWDISTASYSGISTSISPSSQTTGMYIRPDGTKIYVVDSDNDTVYQYSLGTAWDISTLSYDSNSFSVASEESIPRGLSLSSDGTKLFILGQIADRILEYTLNTPWDISTAYYSRITYNHQGFIQDALGFYFKPDGTSFYILGQSNFYSFEFNLTIPWDIRSLPYYLIGPTPKSNLGMEIVMRDVASEDREPQGLTFNDDGTKLYVIGQNAVGSGLTAGAEYIHQYSLSTPWNVTTAGYSTSFYVTSEDDTPTGLFFKPDGTKLYVTGNTSDTVYQYSLGTPWELDTASYDNKSLDVSSKISSLQGLFFNPDGTKLYLAGGFLYQYDLTTPWDVSTGIATSVKHSSVVGSFEAFFNDLYIKPDGTKLYVTGSNTNYVRQLTFAIPWDINSLQSDNIYLQIVGGSTTAVLFKPDGSKVYAISNTYDYIWQCDLLEPWNLNITRNKSLFISGDIGSPTGVALNRDLTKMYVCSSGKDLYQYDFNP